MIRFKIKTKYPIAYYIESAVISANRRTLGDPQSERRRSYLSNIQPLGDDCAQLKNDGKSLVIKASSITADWIKPNHDYSARLNYARLSTATLSYEYSSPAGNATKIQQTISQRTTKMLVICSTTFLIFNSPYSAVLFYSIISKHVLTRLLDILRHFYFMSFCLNFFLYSLCGKRFRQELIALLQSVCRKCCLKSIHEKCLKLSKIPLESSISRTTLRTHI